MAKWNGERGEMERNAIGSELCSKQVRLPTNLALIPNSLIASYKTFLLKLNNLKK